MKFALTSLLIVAAAWASTTSAAPALSTTKPHPDTHTVYEEPSTSLEQYEMRTLYAGADCNGAPISMDINRALKGTKCQPSTCARNDGIDTSVVATCVSGTYKELVQMATDVFKETNLVTMRVYNDDHGDQDCDDKSAWLSFTAVDACFDGIKFNVNKNGDLLTQKFADTKCQGEPASEQFQPADKTGKCKIRTKQLFLTNEGTEKVCMAKRSGATTAGDAQC